MTRNKSSRLSNPVVAFVAGVTLMVLVGALSGQDYNWDLLNYHYASPHLLLSGRYDINIAPSGMQSWFNPIGYVPAYLAITYLPPWFASAMLAAASGLNAPLIYLIAERIGVDLPERVRVRAGFACVAIGMSGALTLSEAGTTFLDIILSIAVLGAVLSTLTGMRSTNASRTAFHLAIAGLLLGAACGLKLTNVVMAAGMTGAIAVLVLARRTSALAWIVFALGGAAGFLLTGGWWAWRMWRAFGNPVFPMLNGVFRSPFATPRSLIDTTFLPRDWTGLFAFPWHWLVGDGMPGTEIAIRDPRWAVAIIGSAGIALAIMVRRDRNDRRHDGALLIAAFCLCTYCAWIVSFAILRYVVALEMMSGIVLLAALSLLPARHAGGISAIMILAAFAITLDTRHADWGRVPFSNDWFGARGIEQVHRPGTLYILPSDLPLGFLIHLFPSDARFIRIGGTFPLTPGKGFGAEAIRMIRTAPHLRSLSVPPEDTAEVRALRQFGLAILPKDCRAITTKRAAVESCALMRVR